MSIERVLIGAIILTALWVRFAPATVWYLQSREAAAIHETRSWYENCHVVFEWSWWSLRFTDIHPDCDYVPAPKGLQEQ